MKYTTTHIADTVDIRNDHLDIEPTTIVETLIQTVKNHGSKTAMAYKVNDQWVKKTWNDYYNMSCQLAQGFIKFGLEEGDGVAILGFNHPNWFIANMAAIMAGGVSVGIYTTNTADLCEYIITDSNSKIVVVEDNKQLEKILSKKDKLKLKAIIVYNEEVLEQFQQDIVFSWHSFSKYIDIKTLDQSFIDQKFDHLKPNKCSTLIYTSGTTGLPKGVMLSHDNIIWTTKTVLNTVNITNNTQERIVSYLPLSHVAGQMMDIYMPIVNGGSTWFAEPTVFKGTLTDTLREVQPTIFLGVPRVWIKIEEKIKAIIDSTTGLKKSLLRKALSIGTKITHNHKPFGYTIMNALVYKKIRNSLGLTHCKLALTGAAPIAEETVRFFNSLNVQIYDIYGMSECAGPMSVSYPGTKSNPGYKPGSSGKPVPFTTIKIDENTGEICTYGRHVMMGYLNKEQDTNKTIDSDGLLHSGDIGKLDDDGFLHITGRIKELLITEGGENIPPVLIEDAIKEEVPIISNCMLIGDKKHYLTMLVTLRCRMNEDNTPSDELDESVTKILAKLGSTINTVNGALVDISVNKLIQDGITRYNNNKAISAAQKVQKYKILPTDFSIPGGELGPTLKLKRHVVMTKYVNEINLLYTD